MDPENKINHYFSSRVVLNILLIIIVVNIVFLDAIFLQGFLTRKPLQSIQSPVVGISSQNNCSNDCLKKVDAALSLIKTASISSETTLNSAPLQKNAILPLSQPQEFYIPFGSGSLSSTIWQNVPGLQANIDSGAYPTLKTVVFEVSLHVPTGNETASVRLYDATDNHQVWNSQVDFSGTTSSVFESSKPLSLDQGNKVYVVQMQTQLNYQAVIDQSRIHIITK